MSTRVALFWLLVTVALLGVVGCSNAAAPAGNTASAGTAEKADLEDAAPTPIGPTAATEEIQFVVSLNLLDEVGLADFLARLNDPASAEFHRYLTAAEFGERFGLPTDEVDRVVSWLESGGLTAAAMPQRTSIAVGGSVGDVNKLLGVRLEDWTTADGERFHRPNAEPVIPAKVGAQVATILGLDTEPVLKPAFGGILASGVPAGGLVPKTVARAYEIEPLHDAGFRGEGQTVAIVSFDTYTPSDVDFFDEREGFDSPTVELVRLRGARETPGSDTGEVALDIQVIRGIAPKARIINYEGPNTHDGYAALMARIVADGLAKIVNISWGLCEKYTLRDSVRAEEREFAAAFAAGVSTFVSSGDNGAFDCRQLAVFSDPFKRDLSAGASWPATSPSTIGVGGTFLSVREDGTYINEVGWEDPLSGSGGGGGLSVIMDRPSWQVGAGVENAESNHKRQVPDVAGPADPASGFLVVYTEPGQGLVGSQVGGTSAAAPFWAGSMALAAQMAAGEGIPSLGALGPTLYQISAEQPAGAVFHDIIRGGNLLFEAAPGWDYSTGLGTPRVAPLARALVDFLKN